ncbi:MAG: porin family protein [Chlorobium sp.]|nr:MAG: porin family protein [Chlorobium sp.]
MKKLLLTALIAGMSAAPALAHPYVSGSVGLGIFGNSESKDTSGVLYTGANGQTYKSGIPFAGAIGLKNDAYRVEVALGYQTNDLKTYAGGEVPIYDDSISTLTYMVNGYYDVDVKSKNISPYVMAGLGGASITAKNAESNLAPHAAEETSTSIFAWQIGAGVGIKTGNNITIDLGYRYLKPSKFHDSYGEYTASTSNFLAGIRYDFQ